MGRLELKVHDLSLEKRNDAVRMFDYVAESELGDGWTSCRKYHKSISKMDGYIIEFYSVYIPYHL